MKFLKSLAAGIIIVSAFAFINCTNVEAAWKNDDIGWWYTDESTNTYITGWKYIDNNWYYFNSDGYMHTGWFKEEGNWYYFYSQGNMAHDCYEEGYYLGSSGAWTSNIPEKDAQETFIASKNKNINSKNINKNVTAYLSATGKKYHSRSDCNNMNPQNAIKTTVGEAEAMGFEQCNSCW